MSRDDNIHPSLAMPPVPTDLTDQQHDTPERAHRQRPRRLVAIGALLAVLIVVGGLVLFPVSGRFAGPHNAVSALICTVTGRVERAVRSVGSDPSGGLVLRLSATTVHPGEVITRTVTGGTGPDFITASAMQLQQCVNGSWQTIYYLGLSQTNPQSEAGSNLAITAQGLFFRAFEARIPPVPAGTYRISLDVGTPRGSGTVYAMITVTAS